MSKPGLWIQSPMTQVPDLSQPPHLFPTIPATFNHAIGDLIVHWGLMEQQMNILLWALLKHNGTREDGWRTRGFDKRYDLFTAEWSSLSRGYPTLAKFPDETKSKIRTWKTLRDAVSHKEMVLGLEMDGNHFVQFYNKSRAKQKTKPYRASDFTKAAEAAASAAGWFFWICQSGAVWPLPSPDTQILRSLPNTDHLRLPT